MQNKTYGEWAFSGVSASLDADHILGCQLLLDRAGRPDWIDLQFRSADDGEVHQVRLAYPDALFLLSCLKAIQLDCGTPFPDDPRAG